MNRRSFFKKAPINSLKHYWAEGQGFDVEGNILYNILTGAPPEIKIVYGVDSTDGQPGSQPIDPILQTPFQLQGTLFQEVRYSSGGAGHFFEYAVGPLWNFIQTQIPEMAGDTVLIAMPERGRNYEPNTITDKNDWYSFDHDLDANSRRISTTMAGPYVEPSLVVGSPENPIGDAADIVPTIVNILGIKDEVMGSGFIQSHTRSLIDRI